MLCGAYAVAERWRGVQGGSGFGTAAVWVVQVLSRGQRRRLGCAGFSGGYAPPSLGIVQPILGDFSYFVSGRVLFAACGWTTHVFNNFVLFRAEW